MGNKFEVAKGWEGMREKDNWAVTLILKTEMKIYKFSSWIVNAELQLEFSYVRIK